MKSIIGWSLILQLGIMANAAYWKSLPFTGVLFGVNLILLTVGLLRKDTRDRQIKLLKEHVAQWEWWHNRG